MHPILTAIKDRYSPVDFQKDVLSEEEINSLFDAARRAASSFNEQPWRFIYATKDNPEEYQRLLDLLVPQNQEWAKRAPVLMLTVASTKSSVTGKDNIYAFHDTGMAVGNLLAQATSMGIYVHQMGGYDREKARDNLHLPEDHAPVAMIALGYRQPNEERKPLDRNAISSFVYKGQWS
ncbi:MAG: nitroreductase family protein [Bacteroidota bacterium]